MKNVTKEQLEMMEKNIRTYYMMFNVMGRNKDCMYYRELVDCIKMYKEMKREWDLDCTVEIHIPIAA